MIDAKGVLHLLERVAGVTTVARGNLLFPSKLEAFYEGACASVFEQMYPYMIFRTNIEASYIAHLRNLTQLLL